MVIISLPLTIATLLSHFNFSSPLIYFRSSPPSFAFNAIIKRWILLFDLLVQSNAKEIVSDAIVVTLI